jgi:hypothetical protein
MIEKNSNLEAKHYVVRVQGLKFIAGYDDPNMAYAAAAQFTATEDERVTAAKLPIDPQHAVYTREDYLRLRPEMRPPPPDVPVLPPEPVRPSMADYAGGTDDAERDFLARCYQIELENYRKQLRQYNEARPVFEEATRVYKERKARYDSIFGA